MYLQILMAVSDTRILKLTKKDDEIYEHFREAFPSLEVATIDEKHIKSSEEKTVSYFLIMMGN